MTSICDVEYAPSRGAAAIASAEPPHQPNRILVVEGDPFVCQLLTHTLNHAGWTVDAVHSAQDALTAFQRLPYAMVILESDGIRLNGYDIARSIREMEGSGRRTPIIALTSDTLQSDRKKRKAAGIDNYIAKPFRPGTVETILARYCHASSADDKQPQPIASIDVQRVADLFEMVQGNAEQWKGLIDAYLANSAELLDTMRRAEEDANFGLLWEASRSLKSVSAQVGAHRIHDICTAIEVLSRAGSAAGVAALLQELSLAQERAQRDLRSIQPDAGRRLHKRSQREFAAPGEILVAENDPLTARFLVTALCNNGFQVTHVTDGNAALAKIAGKVFQAVIVNASLPGMDGFGVLSETKLRPEYQVVPVILLSSRGREQDVLRAFDLGADDHIPMPFNPMEVVCRIQRLVKIR